MPYLIQRDAEGKLITQWELDGSSLTVGRSTECSVQILDDEMSRRHFKITFEDGAHHITDLNTTNGTWVNKEKIQGKALQPDDRIMAGSTYFLFQVGLNTMIQELADEPGSYGTQIRKISNETK